MKILFLGKAEPDYQSDALFHGLRLLMGDEIEDFPKHVHMLKGGPSPTYGLGFTLFNLLPDVPIDREDIPGKIERGYYDLVIVAGDWCSQSQGFPFAPLIVKHVPPGRIFFVDGADDQGISRLARHGVYFKRENTGTGHPIGFAMPEEKMVCGPWPRKRKVALYEPGQPYLYETEQDYYDGYREADFAHTRRKAGWDCLRHYEIMAAGCIPIFENIRAMPPQTAPNLPRKALVRVLAEEGWKSMSEQQVADVGGQFHLWAKAYCTTEALALYVLSHAPQKMPTAIP